MVLLSRSECADEGTLHASNFSTPKYLWRKYGAPCGCSTLCAHYKDCCLNSEHYVEEEQRWGTDRPSCIELNDDYRHVYMTSVCPPDWDDDETRAKCETYDVVPLTSRRTNISYSNVHCAVCNKDFDPNTDILWTMTFGCEGSEPYFSVIIIISGDHNTTYVRVMTRIYPEYIFFNYSIPVSTFSLLRLYPGTEDSRFRIPSIVQFHANDHNDTCSGPKYSLDADIMSVCNPNIISTCAADWEGSEVEARCLAYTDKYCHETKVYRNPDCAYCNHVDSNVTNICSAIIPRFGKIDFIGLWHSLISQKGTHPDEGKKTERCSFLVVPSVLQLHSFLP
jgi:hypothetical protein